MTCVVYSRNVYVEKFLWRISEENELHSDGYQPRRHKLKTNNIRKSRGRLAAVALGCSQKKNCRSLSREKHIKVNRFNGHIWS